MSGSVGTGASSNSASVFVELNSADISQIDKNLQGLSNEIRNKTLEKALLAGADIALSAARVKVARRTGNLFNSLKKQKVSEPGAVIARVYASRSGSNRGGYYAHLVEYGHKKIMRRGRKLIYVGFQPADPFIRPALEENTGEILKTVGTTIEKTVEGFKGN